MKNTLVFLIVAALCVGLASCQPAATPAPQPTAVPAVPTAAPAQPTTAPAAAPTTAAASGTPFVVAVIGPMTGGGAQQGQYAMTGAQIAADEINAAGGINGQPIKLMPLDDQGDPAVAATVAQRVVSDPSVQVVIGHLWSSALLAAEPLYVKAGMPVVTPSASNVAVTHSGFNNVIRVCLNDSMGVPPAVAQLVNNDKSKKIAVLYSNDDYGVGALAQVKQVAVQLGAQVVYAGAYKPNVDTDFTVQLTAAVAAGADSMFLASQQTEGGLIVSQASKLGVFDKIPNWDANDGVMYQAFLDRVNATAESHILVVAPYDPFANRAPVQDFVSKFMAQQQNATPSETAWFSYDALTMIRDAYAAGATRATLIDKIKSMTFTDLLTADKVTFDKNGDRAVAQMFNLGVKGGKFYSTGTTPDLTGVDMASAAVIPTPAPTTAPVTPTTAAASGTPFVVAVIGPMTGGGAQQGQYAMTGAQIAADEINAAGGINGQPIKLMPLDDQGDPAVAATVAQRVVSDPSVQVVIGHLWSSALLAAEPLYVKAGMPVVTPSASNVAVTHSGFNNVIRVCLNDAMGVPPAVAQLVNNDKAKKIAVLYSNDDYGVGALAQVKQVAAQLGAQVVYAGAYKPNVDTDFTVQLTAAVAAGADSMFLASQQTEGGLIVSQASKLGVFDKIPNWDANDGVMYQAFLDRVNATAESHILVVAPYDPFANRAPVQDFVSKFMAQQQNATPSETAWFSYDALTMIRDAYAAGATRATLIDKIKSMTFTDLLTADKVTFDKNGDRAVAQMFNLGIKGGKFYSTGTTPDLTGVTIGQ